MRKTLQVSFNILGARSRKNRKINVMFVRFLLTNTGIAKIIIAHKENLMTAEQQVKRTYPEAHSWMGVCGWGITSPSLELAKAWHSTENKAWKAALANVKRSLIKEEVK